MMIAKPYTFQKGFLTNYTKYHLTFQSNKKKHWSRTTLQIEIPWLRNTQLALLD